MLLVLLFSVYAGGRYLVVQMIRQAENSLQMVGTDIKRLVQHELQRLADTARPVAERAADEADSRWADPFLNVLFEPGADTLPVDLGLLVAHDGRLVKGFFRADDLLSVREADTEALAPYLAQESPLMAALRNGESVPGMMVYQGRPYFFSSVPILTPEAHVRGFIILGALLQNTSFLNPSTAAVPGLSVRLTPVCPVSKPGNPAARGAGTDDGATFNAQVKGKPVSPLPGRPVPVVADILTSEAGGCWHIGENAYEIEMPITDILGRKVTALTIRMPGSFTSLANAALCWLTCFIAVVGIVFVIPIFWIQARMILNPLSALSRQIRDIGEHHLDGLCSSIKWPRNDEFGTLASSVNDMVAALARKTREYEHSEQSQHALIAGMPDGLCVFNNRGELVSLRKQPDYAHPIPGLVLGRPIAPPIFPESDCDAFLRSLKEALLSDRTQMMMLCCREADSSYRHFETRISRMDDLQAVVVLRDITREWRERETREHVEAHLAKVQKMESLGTMAAGIAHDFNNILAIIQNTVACTWDHPDPDEREAITTLRQATDKGGELTRELMTYAGHSQTAFESQDPNAMIRGLEKLMGGVVAQNVILDFKLTPGLPPVAADPNQFWKVMINLLKNASEALNGASGRITVSTSLMTLTQQSAANFFSTHPLPFEQGLLVEVEDTGPGIPPEVIDRIFEPFVSTKAVGRGLGLATVFGIIDIHNGGIAIRSELGKGTCFCIWLPLTKQPPPLPAAPTAPEAPPEGKVVGDSPAPAAAAPPAAVEGTSEGRPLVLLVEDDPSILRTTRIALRALGVEALAASSQREAQMLVSQHADEIRLILLDAQTGCLDNVRLLSILRLSLPVTPTVILSGHSETRIRSMFASEPYEAFLGKPYTREELEAVIRRFIAPT